MMLFGINYDLFAFYFKKLHLTNRTKIEILRVVFNIFGTVTVAEVKLEVTVQMQTSVLSRLCC